MTELLECVYEDGEFKPLGELVELKEGERVRVEKKIDFELIKLKKRITIEKIMNIRNELWKSF